jgi:radial spoke head protein 9
LKIENESNHDEIMFWGKINGTVKDYFIAVGLNFIGENNFCSKSFYWCSSTNFNFATMPSISKKLAESLDWFNGLFTGEHDKILLESGAGEGQETYVFENDTLVVTNKGKNITELDRLAHVVNEIEKQCHLVPEGSVKLTPLHEVRRNEAFTGLSKEDAINLSKYCHFRKVQFKDKVDQMERGDSVFRYDFLDVIDDDPIKGSWTLHLDTTESVANIRNLLWPGFYSYHKIGTTLYGSFYCGDGRKNNDLPFML